MLGAAADAGTPPLQLFTAGFADPDLDERDAAGHRRRPHAATRSTSPTSARRPDATLAGDVSTFLDGLDEPVVSSSMYAQWAVMRSVAAHGVTVVVDGQGADELLCGYPALIGPAIADEVRAGGPARAWTALEGARRAGPRLARRARRTQRGRAPAGSAGRHRRPARHAIDARPQPGAGRELARRPAGRGPRLRDARAGPAAGCAGPPPRRAPAAAAALPRRERDGVVGRSARAVPRSRGRGRPGARRPGSLARRLSEVGAARSPPIAPARGDPPPAAQAGVRGAGGVMVARTAEGVAARRAGAGDGGAPAACSRRRRSRPASPPSIATARRRPISGAGPTSPGGWRGP